MRDLVRYDTAQVKRPTGCEGSGADRFHSKIAVVLGKVNFRQKYDRQ